MQHILLLSIVLLLLPSVAYRVYEFFSTQQSDASLAQTDRELKAFAFASHGNVQGAASDVTPGQIAEIAYWKKIAEQYPDYRDAYVQIAYRLYNAGLIDEAEDYIEKALSLDPSYQPAQELKERVEEHH